MCPSITSFAVFEGASSLKCIRTLRPLPLVLIGIYDRIICGCRTSVDDPSSTLENWHTRTRSLFFFFYIVNRFFFLQFFPFISSKVQFINERISRPFIKNRLNYYLNLFELNTIILLYRCSVVARAWAKVFSCVCMSQLWVKEKEIIQSSRKIVWL